MQTHKQMYSFRKWLESSPVDWVQAVACRSALRVLPVAVARSNAEWLQRYALQLFRAGAISWAARSRLPEEDREALTRAAADAAFAVRAAARAAVNADPMVILGADSMANATDAARADDFPPFAAAATSSILVDVSLDLAFEAMQSDRDWLETRSKGLHPNQETIAFQLMSLPLWSGFGSGRGWPDEVSEGTPVTSTPEWFIESWAIAQNHLLSRDKYYNVWTNWFEAIIAGEPTRFSSNSAVDIATVSEIISADDNFWRQQDKVINSTIRLFVEDAEIEEQSRRLVLRVKSRHKSAAGTIEERAARYKLSAALRSLAEIDTQDSGLIGHNMPPEPVQWEMSKVLVADVISASKAAASELEKKEPEPFEVTQRVSLIRKALKKLSSLTGTSAKQAAQEVGKAVGEGAGDSIKTLASKAAVWLGRFLIDWLQRL